jgi:prolyl oligopeptidase
MSKHMCGLLFLLGAFLLVSLPTGRAANGQAQEHLAPPPVAPVKPVTTDYYGTKVVDPYRYMENLKDPKVQAWMKAQNDYTRAVLARIPGHEKRLARTRQLDQSVPRVRVQRLPGDRYLVLKQRPGDNVAKLYLRQGLVGKDRLLVDPGEIRLAPENRGKGRNVVLDYAPSPDDKYVAVGVTPGGAERNTETHIFETATGRETGDVILRAWGFDVRWLPDGHSFIHGRLQKLPPGAPPSEIGKKCRIYLHVLGTDPEKDPVQLRAVKQAM